MRLLKNNYPIIIIFDKEGRSDCFDVVATALENAIRAQEIQDVEIIIGVPDRMFENWMLADIESVKVHYKLDSKVNQENYESLNGKSKIRSIIGSNLKYSETQDGPDIFLLCRKKIMAQNSLSFKCFLESVSELDCQWVKSEMDAGETS